MAADDAAHVRPAEEADDEDEHRDPQPVAAEAERLARDDAGESDGEQQQRKGEEDVHRPADEGVAPAALVAGEDTEQHAERHRQQRGEERDEQGDTCPVEDARQNVAAVDRLDTQWVVGTDAAEGALGFAEHRVDEVAVELVRRRAERPRDERGEQRQSDEHENRDAGGHRDLVTLEAHPRDLAERAALDATRRAGENGLGTGLLFAARNVDRYAHPAPPRAKSSPRGPRASPNGGTVGQPPSSWTVFGAVLIAIESRSADGGDVPGSALHSAHFCITYVVVGRVRVSPVVREAPSAASQSRAWSRAAISHLRAARSSSSRVCRSVCSRWWVSARRTTAATASAVLGTASARTPDNTTATGPSPL